MTFKLSDIREALPVDTGIIEKRVASIIDTPLDSLARAERLKKIISCIDLTTLEGSDTKDRVRKLCGKAINPAGDESEGWPRVAAVCVYSPLISTAKQALQGSGVRVASVSTSFPSGMAPVSLKIEETKYAISEGADEIDMVISRGAFLEGEFDQVFDEIAAIKEICREVHLKVILETGELGNIDNVRKASDIAVYAGADFIKTSTGKIHPAATLPAASVMLDSIHDFYKRHSRSIGFKPAGGISTADSALSYYTLVESVLGQGWLTPRLFRIGASRLLDVLVSEIQKA